jgi:hypothetical protein
MSDRPVTDLDDIATRRAVTADPTLFTSGIGVGQAVLEIRRVRQRRVLPLILRHLAAQTAATGQR